MLPTLVLHAVTVGTRSVALSRLVQSGYRYSDAVTVLTLANWSGLFENLVWCCFTHHVTRWECVWSQFHMAN